MAKPIQLTIPEPCHENWNDMTAAEKGRFCKACQKQVVDFTRMGDAQLAAFFKKPSTGSVCGRFMPDQLDRDIEIPRKRIPWVKYFFQFAIPAFLLSCKGAAQGKVRIAGDTIAVPVPQQVKMGEPKMTPVCENTTRTIKGKIVDHNGKGISAAYVYCKEEENMGTAKTDCAGNFSLNYRGKSDKVSIGGSYLGFESPAMTVNLKTTDNPVRLQINLADFRKENIAGMVFITEACPIDSSIYKESPDSSVRKESVIPSLLKSISDTVLKKFKLFPNPVKAGADLNIQCDKMEEGYYSLQLLTLSGGTVFRKEIWIDDKARLINLPVPAVAAGTYLFRMAHKESGRSSTQKIVIQ